jgi:hypothetical protein
MDLDSFYERLKLAAAARLRPWHEHQEGSSYHIWVAGMTVNMEDMSGASRHEEQKRLVGLIDYPQLCAKATLAKHLGLTLPQLNKVLDGWGYEHVCKDRMYPNKYTEMVIVKTALICAEREGVMARIPIPQESACERYENIWMLPSEVNPVEAREHELRQVEVCVALHPKRIDYEPRNRLIATHTLPPRSP